MKTYKNLMLIIAISLLLIGCGGGSSRRESKVIKEAKISPDNTEISGILTGYIEVVNASYTFQKTDKLSICGSLEMPIKLRVIKKYSDEIEQHIYYFPQTMALTLIYIAIRSNKELTDYVWIEKLTELFSTEYEKYTSLKFRYVMASALDENPLYSYIFNSYLQFFYPLIV